MTDDHGSSDGVDYDRIGRKGAARPVQYLLGAPGGEDGEPGHAMPCRGQQSQGLLGRLTFAEDDLWYCGASPAFQVEVGDAVDAGVAVCIGWAVSWMGS